MIYNLGKFIMTVRGEYVPGETYNILDVVYYNGSSYVSKSNNVKNIIPTNTTYWQTLALSGVATMTETQKLEIIAGILAQGVVIDSSYNNYSEAEKLKLAGLSAPNTGTLNINYGGSSVGTFNADSSVNTTITIPVPSVPSSVTDLNDGKNVPNLTSQTIDGNTISKLDNNVYYHISEPISRLIVEDITYSDVTLPESQTIPPSYIFFTLSETGSISLPTLNEHWYVVDNSLDPASLEAGTYQMEIRGYFIRVEKLTTL